MAQLIRTGATGTISGIGHVRTGVITTVPDSMVDALLATGDWAAATASGPPQRVTEPAPSQAAQAVVAKPRKVGKKR